MKLSEIFLQNPASVSFIALFIASTLASVILFIAVSKKDIKQNRKATGLLAISFAFLSLLFLLFFLEESFFITWNMIFLYGQSFTAALILVFTLQFSYHYPVFDEKERSEARIVLGLSVVYALFELWLALKRYFYLLDGVVQYRPVYADYALLLGFVWMFVVFVRHTIRESRKHSNRPAIWHIFSPEGRTAETLFSFAVLILVGGLLVVLELIDSNILLPFLLQRGLISLGLFCLIGLFLTIYMNYFPETVSVRGRLLVLALITNLAVLSTVAWGLLVPFFSVPVIPDLDLSGSSLKIIPSPSGGYEVLNQRYSFHEGDPLPLDDWQPQEIDLPFKFPFYGEVVP